MVSVIALRNYKRCPLSRRLTGLGMMSGRFGKASAAPPVAGDISAALPSGEELSPPHGLILRPRAHTTTLLIGRVVHHSKLGQRMSALGQKRTLEQVKAMSALLPKADIETQSRDVRFVPKANIGGRQCYSRADLIVTLKEAKKKR